MPRIIGLETAVPPHRVTQETAKAFARKLFSSAKIDIDRMLPVFDHTQIKTRHFCVPPEWFDREHSFAEKNETYCRFAIELSRTVISRLLQRCNVPANRIDHIFFVSTTGFSTPSIDAYLFNLLDFSENIRRTPIWGLGCAGGVAGINRAADWLRGHPESLALVVAVELCGLTFIRNDLSKSNFVATSLFADGCGAALLAGDAFAGAAGRQLAIEASTSVTWKDSLRVMGWQFNNSGLKVIFSKSIPQIVQASARPGIEAFLQRHGRSPEEIDFFLSHPGGAKVIEAYQRALNLEDRSVELMRGVLRDYGNMSSATVFFVLQRFWQSPLFQHGKTVLSTALGPGFSSEMFLATCVDQ